MQQLSEVKAKIQNACKQSDRQSNSVKLLAVSKTQSIDQVLSLASFGQKSFGENYVQEALPKVIAAPMLDWHFIGALQTNKAKQVVGGFSLIHSLDRLELAKKLNQAAQAKDLTQNCLIEVNIDGEISKTGIRAEALHEFLVKLSPLSHLRVQGLMCIPELNSLSPRRPFALLRQLLEKTNALNIYPQKLTELSMGTSADFEAAILEGATIVRIGTALFGPRKKGQ